MKKRIKILRICAACALLICICSAPTYALTEAEAQTKAAEIGKEGVAGNVFIWFLCAVAFLKISQKIDSFMSSLGINVGHTGGSMLAEAMIATRGVAEGKRFIGGGSFGGPRGSSWSNGGAAGANGGAGAFSGGLAGIVGRQFNKGAMKAAAGQGGGGIGGKLFQSSLSKGGGFANSVVGSIAKSDISSVGTMTGDGAAQALASYMGYAGETGGAETPNGQFDGNTGDGESYIDNGVPVDGGAPLNQGVTINSAESYGNSENESAPLNQGNSLSLFKNFGNSGALSGNENPDSNSYAGNTETLGAKEQPIVSGQQGLSGQIGHTGQGGLSGETGGKVQPTADGQAIVSAGQGLGGQAHIGQGTTGGIDKPSEDGQAFYAGQGGAIGHIPDAAPIQNGGVSSDTDPAFTVSGPIGNVSSENGAIPSNSDPAFTVRETVTGSGAIPAFSNVEIGGGRITGVETSSEYPAGVQFGMYSADKYLAPESNYHTLKTVDGAKWYKQYATNAVEKTPYNAPDGTVAYKEKIVQKLPKMPIRKDRA